MTTLQRVRRGMHVRLVWPILRAGVPEDFSNAESLTLHISRVNNSVKTFIPDTHISITGNMVSFIITSEMQKTLTSGEYKATIAYRKVSATSPTLWEPYIKDEPCFALVDSSAEVGGSTTGMEVVTIELDGEIGIPKEGQPGASAYTIAVAHGFEGDEAEWLLSLKQPAIDSAALALQAAGAANGAAGAANSATSELAAIKQFLAEAESERNTAEGNRETKEGQRNQAEQTRNTKEAAREQAEQQRSQSESTRDHSEQSRSTAEGGRTQAETLRSQYELDRKQAETNRENAEQTRETKEGARNQAEQARETKEGERNQSESSRNNAESDRDQAEQARKQAETDRGTTFNQKIQESEQATTAANAAANAQNTYNVTVAVPLAAGVYYNSSSARLAVPVVSRKRGLVLTYGTAAGTWYAERFKGTDLATWTTAANWEQVPDAAQVYQLYSDMNYMYPSIGTSKKILADAGTIKSRSTLNDLTNKFLDLLPNTKLLFCPHLAVKLRESGIYKYIPKLYDLGPGMLDGAQTTALNQPYLSGNIAINEKYALKNPNGGSGYMTHTPISFNATDKWSVSTIINFNGNSDTGYPYYAGQSLFGFRTQNGSVLEIAFVNNTNSVNFLTKKHLGKNSIITWVCLGDGTLLLYLNGLLLQTYTGINTTYIESEIGRGRGASSLYFNIGSIKYHCIRDIALYPTQVQDEYTYLRTIFAEIENVQIGTQYWTTSNCEMACTPQGNVIQEMQAAINVEKLVQPLNLTTFTPTSLTTILDANNFTTTGGGGVTKMIGLVALKYYKITISGTSTSDLYVRTGDSELYRINLGKNFSSKVVWFRSPSTNSLYLNVSGQSNVNITELSVQEIGLSDSTNLYNYTYSVTTGTTEQKEYEAVKAAAMWCHFNNDPALGAVYGKLYNWYAIRLLEMDINYYNVANPTALWGWRVPTRTDFTTLQTYLGGESIAGGKMKKEGLNYWTTPNAAADNSSGFSAIAGGIRLQDGTYTNLGIRAAFLNSSALQIFSCGYNDSILSTTAMGFVYERCYSLRLIKA